MSALLPELGITGVGLWAPGFSEPARVLAGDADAAIRSPKAELLPARLRRRCSLLTRMTAEVVKRAAAPAGVDLGAATVILASVYGEILTTGQLLHALAEEPQSPLSPTRFHNSVHNTAIGYLSIATTNHGGSTAISAGPATLAMALLEAATTVAAGEGPAVVAIAEEPLPPVLAESGGGFEALAVALIVEAWRGQGIHARLSHKDPSACDALPSLPAKLAANPCARAFAAAAAIGGGRARQLALEPTPASGRAWVLEILDQGATKAR